MNILIIDIDSKIPNLALKKVEKYHRDLGDNIEFVPMMRSWADKVYVSCIFTKNRHLCQEWENDSKVMIGGTGYDLTIKLPKEIEDVKPKINIGFTTRGCVRKCDFCIVPQKEGGMQIVGDIYDIWDGKSKEIEILDNNILAMPQHFKGISNQLKKEKIRLKENGLDLRILYANKSLLPYLKQIKHYQYKFAWDIDDDDMVERLKWLRENLGCCLIYVIVGFLPFEKIMWKLQVLKDMGHDPYIMRHEKVYNEKRYIQLARWVNQPAQFKKKTFEQFCESN